MVGTLFLAGSIVGAWFTRNALRRPRRGRVGPLWAPALITSELALHHLTWQAALTALFIWGGALRSWPGVVGLIITMASWVGLIALHAQARRAGPTLSAALDDVLGIGASANGSRIRLGAPLNPVPRLPAGVVHTAGVRYGDHPRQVLDVYRRRDLSTTAPVLVQVHGGSWMRGRRDLQARPLLYHLAEQGWLCVAPSYRVSPRATFPDHLVDVKRALAWVRTSGLDLGVDPRFVAITGGSSGGHLAALAALTAGDPAYQPGFEGVDTSVQACVAFYAVLDLIRPDGRPLWPFLERHVLKRSARHDPEAWRRASPLAQVARGSPPFLVVHGSNDNAVRPSLSRRFVAALSGVSVAPVVYAEIPGATHGFDFFNSVRANAVAEGTATFLQHLYATRLGGDAG